ncbi:MULTISPECIES: ABC transporter substrate-binding protein [Subtercola]|uniref:Branched-chain amino acid ABC transporter substrate-binding protein n=1 Tax=Subtercola vilae TaxID=2056433 RepID=A0A4T2C520_9MICO|nr:MULTISPECIES: ABC transporter substrate-binding protein [Subtercola]MEA9984510.1 ABC transporter substrate-binding protein [Subtercola sp. RTI3]TIH39423.1 branched-chain amino acid ABC transporter substrate-binding protein [Subtercola vilae]
MSEFIRAPRAPRSRSLKTALSAIALVGASALVLSGCASGGSTTSSSSSAGTGLTLNIGTILPQTGSLATLGPPAIEAVNLAAADINAANVGITVNVTQKDSGDTSTNIATQSVTSLLASNVSAIIGAESSSVSLTVIDQIAKAGVVEISPANTSPTFSTYNSNNFYWRTAPSDVLQGRVLGQKVLKDGATNVSILWQNDSYGQGLHDNVTKAITDGGGTIVADTSFDPKATSFSAEVGATLAPKPDAVVVISFDQIKQIVPEFKTAGFDFTKFYGSDGNYGVIDPTYTNVDIAGAQFTNPGVKASDDFVSKLAAQTSKDGAKALSVYSYAPESYDAVVLLALAALQGKATDGTTLKNNLQKVSEGGTKATSFADAAKLIAAGTDVDYDGLSGPISFAANGDPQQAYISIYKYGTGNTNAYESQEFGDLSK